MGWKLRRGTERWRFPGFYHGVEREWSQSSHTTFVHWPQQEVEAKLVLALLKMSGEGVE